jgi:hypothetical protein
LLYEEHVLQVRCVFGGGVVEMPRVLLVAVSFIGVAAVLGLVVFWAYYFGLWTILRSRLGWIETVSWCTA